jgi:CMP-N-acetylneuraminic acid synthetase
LADKHLRPLLGQPVISYTFEHAKASRLLTRTVLSTDCPRIMQLGRDFQAIRRPKELATSDASVQDAMLHALKQVESESDFRADALVVLYGNVPVRPAGVIDEAIFQLMETKCDSVRTFCPVGKWHPAWMSQLDVNNGKVMALQQGSIHRRQDLTPLFLHDGAVVAVSRNSMLRGLENPSDPHAFFGVDRRGIRTASGATVEIDELRDLYWAEAVLRESQQIRKVG